jgi:hypothetical protein
MNKYLVYRMCNCQSVKERGHRDNDLLDEKGVSCTGEHHVANTSGIWHAYLSMGVSKRLTTRALSSSVVALLTAIASTLVDDPVRVFLQDLFPLLADQPAVDSVDEFQLREDDVQDILGQDWGVRTAFSRSISPHPSV